MGRRPQPVDLSRVERYRSALRDGTYRMPSADELAEAILRARLPAVVSWDSPSGQIVLRQEGWTREEVEGVSKAAADLWDEYAERQRRALIDDDEGFDRTVQVVRVDRSAALERAREQVAADLAARKRNEREERVEMPKGVRRPKEEQDARDERILKLVMDGKTKPEIVEMLRPLGVTLYEVEQVREAAVCRGLDVPVNGGGRQRRKEPAAQRLGAVSVQAKPTPPPQDRHPAPGCPSAAVDQPPADAPTPCPHARTNRHDLGYCIGIRCIDCGETIRKEPYPERPAEYCPRTVEQPAIPDSDLSAWVPEPPASTPPTYLPDALPPPSDPLRAAAECLGRLSHVEWLSLQPEVRVAVDVILGATP